MRKGKCNHCGKCCPLEEFKKLQDPFCKVKKMILKDGKYYCPIYKDRPQICRDFPKNQEDLKQMNITNCGFYWEEK